MQFYLCVGVCTHTCVSVCAGFAYLFTCVYVCLLVHARVCVHAFGKLNPSRQAGIQIRLTGPDIFLGWRQMLEPVPNIFTLYYAGT